LQAQPTRFRKPASRSSTISNRDQPVSLPPTNNLTFAML
jgi:hypothetical protein